MTPMQTRAYLTAALATILVPSLLIAKDKSKSPLPTYVLQARTVAIIVDPTAGVSLDDPQANQVAQRDVETAFLNWGRFQPVLDGQSADLIVVVRRGTRKMANGTVHDPQQQNRPPAVIEPTDTGINVGMQHGHPPPYAGQPDASQGSGMPTMNPPVMDQTPRPEVEIGNSTSNDSLLVYRGLIEHPLDGAPIWRYESKNGLKPHSVPAVDAFRKAVDQTEQAAAKQP